MEKFHITVVFMIFFLCEWKLAAIDNQLNKIISIYWTEEKNNVLSIKPFVLYKKKWERNHCMWLKLIFYFFFIMFTSLRKKHGLENSCRKLRRQMWNEWKWKLFTLLILDMNFLTDFMRPMVNRNPYIYNK